MIEALKARDVRAVAGRMGNILETVTSRQHPEIEPIKQRMMELGALNAMMSGSGPTVFGLFDDPEKAQACYQALLSAKDSGLAKQVYLTEPWRQPSRTSPSRSARL